MAWEESNPYTQGVQDTIYIGKLDPSNPFDDTYNSIQRQIQEVKASQNPSETYGYLDKDIPQEYMVRIIDMLPKEYYEKNNNIPKIIIIKAPIQESLRFRTTGEWSTLTAAHFISGRAQQIFQAVAGRTLISKYATRRYWTGSTPIRFDLNLTFQAKRDPLNEVYLPLKELQRMVLPYSSYSKINNPLGDDTEILDSGVTVGDVRGVLEKSFLGAPGPNPFYSETLAKIFPDWIAPTQIGEMITIKIGNIFEFPKVVVKDVHVEIPPTFQRGGMPMTGKVSIAFETYEIVTKEELDGIYSNYKAPGPTPSVQPAQKTPAISDPVQHGPTRESASMTTLEYTNQRYAQPWLAADNPAPSLAEYHETTAQPWVNTGV